MSEMDDVDVEIDDLGVEILTAIEQHDGETTTREVRQFLGVDSTTKINYRVREYLEPQGLLSATQPDGKPGSIPPKELALTEKGNKVLELESESRELNRNLAERIDRLEEQVTALRDENRDLREQLESEQSRPSSTDGCSSDLDDIQEQIANLAMELEELKDDPLFGNQIRTELDAVRTGMLAMRDYLFEVHDAKDDIEKRAGEYEDEIDLLSRMD